MSDSSFTKGPTRLEKQWSKFVGTAEKTEGPSTEGIVGVSLPPAILEDAATLNSVGLTGLNVGASGTRSALFTGVEEWSPQTNKVAWRPPKGAEVARTDKRWTSQSDGFTPRKPQATRKT